MVEARGTSRGVLGGVRDSSGCWKVTGKKGKGELGGGWKDPTSQTS